MKSFRFSILTLLLAPFPPITASTCPIQHDDASKLEVTSKMIQSISKKTKDNVYAIPTRKPGKIELLNQKFQIYTLQHPNTFLGKFIQPIVSLLEGFAPAVMFPEYSLPKKRLSFGQNFCAAGTVVLSEWDVVVNALTSPQARTFRLGTGILESSHLPGMVIGKRNTWVSCF